jgi:NADH-quinone oxidoreductase subunit K
VNVGLSHFLFVSAALFSLGLFAVMSRRSAIGILMGVELLLNASNINFVAFSRYVEHGINGQIMGAFIIVLAAAEAAVALAIVLAMYRNFGTANADAVHRLKL